MRKILIALLISLFGGQVAFADTCATKLMPIFTSNQAVKLCQSFGSAINSSMIPSATNTYDLGTSALRWKDLYLSGNLNFNAASAKIVPGATSLLIRNNADNASNIAITDAGVSTYRGNWVVTQASHAILMGATNMVWRDSADTVSNFLIASAGGVTVPRSDLTITAGDMISSASGKTISIQEATASTACMGVATPNGTTPVTVTTSCAVTGSRVIFSRVGAVANMASISVTTNPNNTSFAFASTGASDTLASSVVYLIVKESA